MMEKSLNYEFNTYFQNGKPSAVKPVEINYTTNSGRGTIKMDMVRVFPCTVHDVKTIIDTLWMSADPYEIAGTICDYIKSVVADLQEIRPDEAYTADDKKYNAKITGFIKRYIANLDKIAGAFGFDTVADEKAQAQTMKKCEIVCYECYNGQQVALPYSGYSFEKAGYTFQVTKKKYKNLYTVIVPCLGLSCAEYNGTLKETPEHITENIINMLNRWTINEWGPAREKFVKVCADTLEYFTVPALPDRFNTEQTAEPATAPATPATAKKARKDGRNAKKDHNTIKRNTKYIIARALVDTNAGKAGEVVRIYFDNFTGWILEHENGARFACFIQHIRNTAFYEILSQSETIPAGVDPFTMGNKEKSEEPQTETRADRAQLLTGSPVQGPQVWKPCTMTAGRKNGIIYHDIMGATDQQEPASADRLKAVLRLPKMQGYINLGATDKNPVTGTERSHKATLNLTAYAHGRPPETRQKSALFALWSMCHTADRRKIKQKSPPEFFKQGVEFTQSSHLKMTKNGTLIFQGGAGYQKFYT